ncbi:MAG: hypothetical protein GW763_01045 [Paraglaciecola sp.]|nr:hypothetical protein [Paraglaciecola sp.]NCT46580.1 hypothetical protein [Paraglaciecola sp.]
MNLQRYKVKLTPPGSGETKFEFLGTWIGFAGMLLIFANISLAVSAKSAFGASVVFIGVAYGLYWFATQIRIFLYLLCLLALVFAAFFGAAVFLNDVDCNTVINTYQHNLCVSKQATPFFIMLYQVSIFFVALYFIIRSKNNGA